MRHLLSTTARFTLSEDGAVSVDWVVLSAAIMGLCIAALAVVSDGVRDVIGDVATSLTEMDIQTAFAEPEAAPEATPFQRNQWAARTGNLEVLETWIGGFGDQQLLTHMNNQQQFASTTLTGHPYDTYHDEYWVARDEAVTRGLIPENHPV